MIKPAVFVVLQQTLTLFVNPANLKTATMQPFGPLGSYLRVHTENLVAVSVSHGQSGVVIIWSVIGECLFV